MRWNYERKTALPEPDDVWDQEKADRGGYSKTQLKAWTNRFLKDHANELDPETGKRRGVGGDNPILFPEHEHTRRQREIISENGVPDPNIVSGSYWRAHPKGRRVNSPERRARGASWYA